MHMHVVVCASTHVMMVVVLFCLFPYMSMQRVKGRLPLTLYSFVVLPSKLMPIWKE